MTNETRLLSVPDPGNQAPTPSSQPGPQQMGPSTTSRMQFDPSVSSESPRVGVVHPVCLLRSSRKEEERPRPARGGGGVGRGGGSSRRAQPPGNAQLPLQHTRSQQAREDRAINYLARAQGPLPAVGGCEIPMEDLELGFPSSGVLACLLVPLSHRVAAGGIRPGQI